MEEFLATAFIYPLDDAVIKKTIELRRIKKIKLGDAIVASTALVYDLILITEILQILIILKGLIVLIRTIFKL